MNIKTQKIIPLSIGVLVFSLFAAYLLHAWTEPALPPPQGNVEVRAGALATTTGTPVPTDCDEPAERGRVRIDPATERQYICGNLGWTFLAVAPARHTLTVTITGSGTVTSSPAGINCPGDCTHEYVHGTSVTLTATPASGWTFAGWGGDCTGTGTCIVTMTAAKSVTATFSQIFHTLTVSVTGSGTVTSSPAGINCPGDCTEDYAHGTSVTLTATPDTGLLFLGWGGACSGTVTTCTLVITGDTVVEANFQADLDGDGHLAGSATECNDHCATCFVGSTHFTLSPDGLDQDCDGVIDDSHTVDSGERTNVITVFDPKAGGVRLRTDLHGFCYLCHGRDTVIGYLCTSGPGVHCILVGLGCTCSITQHEPRYMRKVKCGDIVWQTRFQ